VRERFDVTEHKDPATGATVRLTRSGRAKVRASRRERFGPDENEDLEEGATLRVSGEYEILADLTGHGFTGALPLWLELSVDRPGDSPSLFARMELRDQRPEIVAMNLSSGPGQREIKQRDLREIQLVHTQLFELYSTRTLKVVETEGTRFVQSARRDDLQVVRAPGHRPITDEFLASVADVYRRNIAHAPTQAVARTFGVKSRMASNYVDKARRAGLLPPTKQGQKKA
jgi:hypothetical protein